MSPCGELLFGCQCNGHRTPLRTFAEVEALHHQAVRRAQWSGHADDRIGRLWAAEVLLPGTVAKVVGQKMSAA